MAGGGAVRRGRDLWEARKEGLWLGRGPRSDTTQEGEFPGQSNVQEEEGKRGERKQEFLALQLLPLGPVWFPSSISEFTDCWENFVDHEEPPSFNPSEKLEELDKNSRAIKRRLERIKVRSCPACCPPPPHRLPQPRAQSHLCPLPLPLPFILFFFFKVIL